MNNIYRIIVAQLFMVLALLLCFYKITRAEKQEISYPLWLDKGLDLKQTK